MKRSTGLRVMVQADRDLTAMEMAFTLPDQTESEGNHAHGGRSGSVADDGRRKTKRNRRRRTNKAQQERSEEPVAEDGEETGEETDTATADSEDGDEGKPSVGVGAGGVVDDVGGGTRMARPQLQKKIQMKMVPMQLLRRREDKIAPEAETGDETAPVEMDAADTESKTDDSLMIVRSDENTDTVVEMVVNEP